MEFRKLATQYKRTMNNFQRSPALQELFPKIYQEIKTSGIIKHFLGEVDFVILKENYGFINCKETGRVHFSRGSLINNTMWEELKKGDSVTFGILVPKLKENLPHAINLEIVK